MKEELIEHHRKLADWNFNAARTTKDDGLAGHRMSTHEFHKRAVAWLATLMLPEPKRTKRKP